jgi:hypothetical protein
MQGRDKDSALDDELKGPIFQEIAENLADAEPLPQLAKQQRAADPLCRNQQGSVGVFIERIDEKDLIGELGARGEQRGQGARSGKRVRGLR